jgi:hypothetical protein
MPIDLAESVDSYLNLIQGGQTYLPKSVFLIRKFLGLPDPYPLVRGTDPYPDHPIK